MKIQALVETCPLFRGIAPADLPVMLQCLKPWEKSLVKGEQVLTDTPRLIGVVLAGSVQMFSEDVTGRQSLLAILPLGSIFGESDSCAGSFTHTISYRGNEEGRILLLDYSRVFRSCKLACKFHHRMIENMVEQIAVKNLMLVEKIEILSCGSIRGKLLAYLERQAYRSGGNDFFIPLGRAELADYLCVDRSAMTRELSHMRAEGLLDYEKRHFVLHGRE